MSTPALGYQFKRRLDVSHWLMRDVLIGIGVAIALMTGGCSAIPGIIGTAVSGGTSLYKSEKSYGPKVEVVIFKAEINRTVVTPTK